MRLKAVRSTLATLPPTLGGLPVVERTVDQRRNELAPWRKLYKTARWSRLRLVIFERDLFTCQRPGCGFTSASTADLVCDHRKPHRGDLVLFWAVSNLWTLCKPCHDGWKQRLEQRT